MLSVDIEKIIPVTEARDMFNKIVDEVEGTDEMYVLTKNGKPSAVVVGVNHLEKLTGAEGARVMANIDSTDSIEAQAPAAGSDTTMPSAPAQSFGTMPEAPAEPVATGPTPVSEPAPVEPGSVAPNLPPVEPTPAYTAPDPFAAPAENVPPQNPVPNQPNNPPQTPNL